MDVKRNQIKIQKQTEKENIIKNIKNPFKLKKRKSIKDRTIRDNIKILLKNKMIIINHKEQVIFGIITTSNMKVMVIEIKTYQ